MCGIAGFWSTDTHADIGAAAVGRMTDAIVYRGPDSGALWVDPAGGPVLGHRRLAIVDLSPHGSQPMVSRSGRYVITFNGEIVNFRQLRRELAGGYAFAGESDTEALLAAIEHWGLAGAVDRLVGMFAFALWDRETHNLHLVRDRIGIKPLVYGWINGAFIFASELRAIRQFPGFAPEINRGAVSLLLRHNCIPAPYTIYNGFWKLPPAHSLTLASPAEGGACLHQYWSAADVALRGATEPARLDAAEATQQLHDLLIDAVGLHMVSDVPLGAFLSGGVDSSVVAALMQAQAGHRVRTFSIGSPDRGYDEAPNAVAVSRHLGTDHTELYVTAEDALQVVPRLPELYDEPFADSSQIPTYLVSRLARGHVTVSLSGDGGDELFGGYNRHLWAPRLGWITAAVPLPLRHTGARALQAVSPGVWDSLFAWLPESMRLRMPGYKIQKLSQLLAARSSEDMYRLIVSHWHAPDSVVIGATEPPTRITGNGPLPQFARIADRTMFLDLVTYLPDDILTKLDRATMAVSLEARVPLLDHRVVEFAWALPHEFRVRDGQSKWILRQVLYRYVPRELIDRPKSGFGVPVASWLRGPLREWAEELLAEDRLEREGFFQPVPVRQAWKEHLSGRRDWQYQLWNVLMFQGWLDAQRAAPTATPSPAMPGI
jgi:asparagine synthase (glutamine-hydrolysing)